MTVKWIRNIGLGALATVACLVVTNPVQADGYNGGNHYGCSPQFGYSNFGYRPVVIQQYYGTNFGVGGYARNYGYSNNYGGFNNFGGGFGVGGYPMGSSYGGGNGAFPRGGSYGGGNGAFPRGGSYGGGLSGR